MTVNGRWLKMMGRIHGTTLMIQSNDWYAPLPAGSTTGTPLTQAVYGANWGNHADFLVYTKDPMGIVRFRGSVQRTPAAGAAGSQTILTMPVGFRIASTVTTATAGWLAPASLSTTVKLSMDPTGGSAGALVLLGINAANGVLAADAALDAGSRIYLDGVSYRAEDI